jgi:hypothetical protein
MTTPVRIALVVFSLALGGAVAYAQTTPGPAGPPLGRGHLWVKIGRADFGSDSTRAWAVDSEGYVGLEGYRGSGRGFYFGGEVGRFGTGRVTTPDGDTLRDIHFLWLELNEKLAFDLKRGLSIDAGVGVAFFYVDGQEVTTLSGLEFTSPLADVGRGVQVFADLNWRKRRLLLGLDVKYQWAFDVVNLNYSNLRLGGHVGIAF